MSKPTSHIPASHIMSTLTLVVEVAAGENEAERVKASIINGLTLDEFLALRVEVFCSCQGVPVT